MSAAGRLSSAALALSGLAGVLIPERVAEAMDLTPTSGRGLLEVRAGLGASYVALGTWAFLVDSPAARRAVGMAWLGAATGRITGMAVDDPRTDAVHWGSLALELGGGLSAWLSGRPTGRA